MQTSLFNTDVCSNQHEQGTKTYQGTDKLGTDDDAREDIALTRDDLENITVEIEDNNNEDDP